MRFVAPSTLVIAGLALLPGCFLVNDPGDHQTKQVPADEFCGEFADVVCDAHLRCCSTATVAREQCVSNWTSICANQVGSLSLDPRTGYDPALAAEVLAEGRALTAECSVEVSAWFESRSGFQRVLAGTVAGGGECTPKNLLDFPAYFSCIERDQACVQVASNRSICAELRPEGDPCHAASDCAEGLWCDGGGPLTEGACAPTLAEGEPCTGNQQCESLVCDTDATGRCVIPEPDVIYCTLGLS
jgi:hypothetical protein